MHMKGKGITLVELLMVITLTSIILAIAVPSFRVMIQNNRLVTGANELVAALNLARSEAVKRNQEVKVSSCTASSGCTALGADWAAGRVVWLDVNDNNAFDAAAETLRLFPATEGATVTESGGSDTVTFDSRGAVDAAACFDISVGDATSTRRLVVNAAGSISVDSGPKLSC